MIDSAVRDFPEPDSPMSPTRSPGAIVRDTPSTTGVSASAGVIVSPATSRRVSAISAHLHLRVEAVPQPVAEEVESEDGERDEQARPQRELGVSGEELLGLLEHPSP